MYCGICLQRHGVLVRAAAAPGDVVPLDPAGRRRRQRGHLRAVGGRLRGVLHLQENGLQKVRNI